MDTVVRHPLLIVVVDKLAIAGLLLFAGYKLNQLMERFKADRARENDRERLRAQKLDYLERQLSEFYYPICVRLHIDTATWRRILDREHGDGDIRAQVGARIERDVLLPNHEAIVSIIQSKFHLAEDDPEGFDTMLKYVRHVAVYRAMRAVGFNDRDPISLDEPWPRNFLPIMERTAARLQREYDALLAPSGKAQ